MNFLEELFKLHTEMQRKKTSPMEILAYLAVVAFAGFACIFVGIMPSGTPQFRWFLIISGLVVWASIAIFIYCNSQINRPRW